MLGELAVDIFSGAEPKEERHYEGHHAVLAGTSTLAGAVEPLDACLNNFMAFTGAPLGAALSTVTLHPAAALGLQSHLGVLQKGAWADLVLLQMPQRQAGGGTQQGQQVKVLQTWVGGARVYEAAP